MLFAATAVANGAGTGIVNSIGMATEIGKIQAQIQEAAKEEDDTPLKKKIDEFGELLAKVGWTHSREPHRAAAKQQMRLEPLS
jgi:P-type Ca2+ transporter type 2C